MLIYPSFFVNIVVEINKFDETQIDQCPSHIVSEKIVIYNGSLFNLGLQTDIRKFRFNSYPNLFILMYI